MRKILAHIFLLIASHMHSQSDTIRFETIVDSVFKVVQASLRNHETDSALQMCQNFEMRAKDLLGSNSLAYGKACFLTGVALSDKRDFLHAEKKLSEAKGVLQLFMESEMLLYADAISYLATAYKALNQFDQAESFYKETIAIRELQLGKRHPDYMWAIGNLGSMYSILGNYAEAELLLTEAYSLRSEVLGNTHPDFATSCQNLASLYLAMQQIDKAEIYYLKCLEVRENSLGKNHVDYVNVIDNLANFYLSVGQFEKSEYYFMQSLNLYSEILGTEHTFYAAALNGLGALYLVTEKYEKAEPLLLQAKEIRGKIWGLNHPYYASTLNRLGILYLKMEKFEKAESNLLKAAEIRKAKLGSTHPDYGSTLKYISVLYIASGQYAKAEQPFIEAKDILENSLGIDHPDFSSTLHELANLYVLLKKYSLADSLFALTVDLDRNKILRASGFMSEKEVQQYLETFEIQQDDVFSFGQRASHEKRISQTCFDNTLFHKGYLLNSLLQSKKVVLKDSVATRKYEEWLDIERELSGEYAKPIGQRKGIFELETGANKLEKEISRYASNFEGMRSRVGWEDVQKKLSSQEAAVEFIRYHFHRSISKDTVMYAALVLTSSGIPKFVTIGEERTLDSFLNNARFGTHKSTESGDLVSRGITLANVGYDLLLSDQIYNFIWKPIASLLNGVKRIYYAPSGKLHSMNLSMIQISQDSILSDRHKMVRLGSTRQLVVPNIIINSNQHAILVGGIEFNRKSMIKEDGKDEVHYSKNNELLESNIANGNMFKWEFLPGTESEVNEISDIMNNVGLVVTIRHADDATEDWLKEIGNTKHQSPKIVHIATHGFFLSDTFQNDTAGMKGQQLVLGLSENPLLRSGLILSGANYAWCGGQIKNDEDDGILTAFEISQMNLSNTELVVLSACETGLGDIQGNEGVYGLQRAFKIAGAKYIIMSLWQVPDKQTSLLMTTFYKKWLEEKMTIPEAFHAAQKQLRDAGLDAYQWAGFVLVE